MTEEQKKDMEISDKKAIEQGEGESTHEGVRYVPDVDIVETDDAITMWVDMPGVKRENVDIDLQENVLTLTGTVDPPPEARPVYREYAVGGFQRRFTLGEKIDQEKIAARLDNGVMTLTLPKAAPHKPRKIEIG
jgi:HSP20 family protein